MEVMNLPLYICLLVCSQSDCSKSPEQILIGIFGGRLEHGPVLMLIQSNRCNLVYIHKISRLKLLYYTSPQK